MKKRVYDSDEDDGSDHETEAMGIYLLPLLDLLFSFFFFLGNFLMQFFDYSISLFP